MRFALCNEMFGDTPPEDVFAAAADLGYDAVEIAPFTIAPSVADVSPRRRAGIRAAAEARGLAVAGTHWLLVKPAGLSITSPDAAVRARTAAYFADLVDFTADIGGGVMVLGSPKQRTLAGGLDFAGGLARLREVVAPALERAAVRSISLCLEPLGPAETDFINTAAEAVAAIRAIGHPSLGLILDVKAMSSEGKPIPAIIREAAPLLRHFHANDPNLLGPGMGSTDFAPILAALRGAGYAGYVSVEVFDFSPGARKIAAESIAYLRAALAAADAAGAPR